MSVARFFRVQGWAFIRLREQLGSSMTQAQNLARRILPRVSLLVVLLLLLLVQKLAFNPEPIGVERADGSFYYQIARHVSAGDGLLTDVSLYNKGLKQLPAPTTVYPLWPLVLGLSGRWMGLHRAAWLVPEILFFVDLVLLYLLANRIGAALGGSTWLRFRGVPVLDLGHVAVLILGTNAIFFVFTSVPWTEGLAFGFLFGALLAVAEAVRRRSIAWAAVAGAVAGLAYLTRSQMIGVPLAVVSVLILVGRERSRGRLAGAAFAASAATILPWILYLASFVTHFPPRMLVDFLAYRETPQLPPYAGLVTYGSHGERLADWLGSFVYAFDPTLPLTYVSSFGAVVYLVPVTAGVACWRSLRRPRAPHRGLDARGALVAATVVAALLCLLPLHAFHETSGTLWRFGHRQGLPMVLGLVLALGACWSWGRKGRTLVILVLGLTLWTQGERMRRTPGWVRIPAQPTAAELRMLDWLDAHPEPPLVLATTTRELAAWRGVTGHDIRCDWPEVHTRQLLRHLDIDYVMVYADEQRCPFTRGLEGLAVVRRFGRGGNAILVYQGNSPASLAKAEVDHIEEVDRHAERIEAPQERR